MQSGYVSRLVLPLAVVGVAVALSGCSSVREALGNVKAAPDEFTVVTASPLVVPPDFNLRPPQPGAAPRNQADPSAQAHAALYTTAPEQAFNGTYSPGEQMLLAKSGAANVDPSIRQQISTETGYDATDPALTDRVLGVGAAGTAPAPQAAPAPAPAQ